MIPKLGAEPPAASEPGNGRVPAGGTKDLGDDPPMSVNATRAGEVPEAGHIPGSRRLGVGARHGVWHLIRKKVADIRYNVDVLRGYARRPDGEVDDRRMLRILREDLGDMDEYVAALGRLRPPEEG